jgi:hypothetical protein
VLGALILMPLMLGMSAMVLQIGGDQWMSLIGHLIYGVVTGLAFLPLFSDSRRFPDRSVTVTTTLRSACTAGRRRCCAGESFDSTR